jgi:hypothetical protein
LSEVRWTRTTVGGPNYLGGSVTVTVGLHLPVAAVGVLHDLVNDKLRVATSVEAPNP